MNDKTCFKCKITKPFSQYYKHKGMKDGYMGKCKDCSKKDVKVREEMLKLNSEWVDSEKERCRKKNKPYSLSIKKYPHLKQRKSVYMKNYNTKFPEKYKAKIKMYRSEIKESGYHLHHWSYNEPHYLDVIKLTVKEHNKAHRFLVYDQERFMYRRYDTNELLDTREKHEEFIRWCIENKED